MFFFKSRINWNNIFFPGTQGLLNWSLFFAHVTDYPSVARGLGWEFVSSHLGQFSLVEADDLVTTDDHHSCSGIRKALFHVVPGRVVDLMLIQILWLKPWETAWTYLLYMGKYRELQSTGLSTLSGVRIGHLRHMKTGLGMRSEG